jgi:HlyD family secretion protein
MSRWWWALGAVGLLSAAFWLFGRGANDGPLVELGAVQRREEFRSYVTASGEIVAERYADIGSSIMGRVVELPVIEGQSVRQGELLARIDPVQARSELGAAEAGIRALEAEAQAAEEQVLAAEADRRLARARAREATLNRERITELHAQQLVSQADLEAAEATADSAEAQVASAAAAVARVTGSRTAAERRVTQARAQADRARDLLSKTAIEAPMAGVVSRLQVRQGEMVVIGIQNQPGTVLMTVSDLGELNAEVKVAEADVLRVETGQTARVTLEALPDRSFTGRVTEVGASALPQLGTGAAAREFRVEVRLEDPAAGMRPGLTCDAEILVGERRNVTTVPLQAVVLGGDAETRGVFVVEERAARFVPVETGIIGGLDIEVSGIEPGTEVVIGPYQVLRDLNDGDPVRTR